MKNYRPEDEVTNKAINDLAFVRHVEMKESYESPFEALFMVACRASALYVEQWAEQGTGANTLAGIALAADDLADPNRISDPQATLKSLLEMFMESFYDNVTALLGIEDPAEQEPEIEE